MTQIEYRQAHDWIKSTAGYAKKCSNNIKHLARSYQWANVSGEYKMEVSDWIELCPPCHKTYDRIRRIALGKIVEIESDKDRLVLILPKKAIVKAKTMSAQLNITVSHFIEGLIAGVQIIPGNQNN